MNINIATLPLPREDRRLLQRVLRDGHFELDAVPIEEQEAAALAVRRLAVVLNAKLVMDVVGEGDERKIVTVAVPKRRGKRL